MKIYLPDWYPAKRHLYSISLFDFGCFLENCSSCISLSPSLSLLLPAQPLSLYKFSTSLKKIRFFKSIDILDLLIWSEQHSLKLSGELIANVLWPYDSVNLKKRYFETARPLAFSLLHLEGIKFIKSIPNNHSVYI
ncbi:MAG: hypothetical protein RLZZ422_1502 [Pseudomonadota bacterium]